MCLESTPYMTYCSRILVLVWPSPFRVIWNGFYKLPTKPHPKHWSKICPDNICSAQHTYYSRCWNVMVKVMLHVSMYVNEAISVHVNKFSWAVKLSNAHFWFLHFKDCFFFILTAAKQIRTCLVLCLHKDQLFSSVSAGKEKYVFVLIVNLETTETTLGQVRLCSKKNNNNCANLLWHYFKTSGAFELNSGVQCLFIWCYVTSAEKENRCGLACLVWWHGGQTFFWHPMLVCVETDTCWIMQITKIDVWKSLDAVCNFVWYVFLQMYLEVVSGVQKF